MRSMAHTKDMTAGSPAKLIFTFSLPLMLGNVFQQVYTITDSLIISRNLGVDALAALGSADWFDYMMVAVIQSLTQGFAIRMAQQYGAGETDRLRQTVAKAVVYSLLSGIVLTIAAVILVQPVLTLMHTHTEIAWMAREYLIWKFGGLLCSVLLNMTSAMLRAFGDSRTPLVSMASAALINVALDLLFVQVLDLGIGSAALATVMAQGTGGLIGLAALRKLPFLSLCRKDFQGNGAMAKDMFSLAVPMMLQNILISAGGMLVQSQVNRFELGFVAGYTAANKLYGALELAALAYGFAMVTYVGQNYGAQKYDRIRTGIRSSIQIAIVTSLAITAVIFIFSRPLIAMFLTSDSATAEAALSYGMQFLRTLAAFLPVLYILHVLRSVLQGFGDTMTPMISGIAEFCARILMAFMAVKTMGPSAMFAAEIAAWFASDCILVPSVIKRLSSL